MSFTKLLFNAKEIAYRGKGLTFEDVLLIPRHSEIDSRRMPELSSKLTKKRNIDVPIITSNMDTITEKEMVCKMTQIGGTGILHRFMTIEEQVAQVKSIQEFYKTDSKISSRKTPPPIAASIGVKEEALERAIALVEAGVEILTIDIAHGDSIMMLETLNRVKGRFPSVEVIAGNIATPEGVKKLVDNGADAIKVGIGPGSMCTTRIITGCGVPQLSAIAICAEEAEKHKIPLIADGGLKTSGDIVKALCAGASSVMLGSMVAGCLETPGEMHQGQKRYRGMASKEAQVSWRGELPEGMAPEGVSSLVPCKGSVADVVYELMGGIRSGMSYINANTIEQMKDNSLFIEVSAAGIRESGPHGINRI